MYLLIIQSICLFLFKVEFPVFVTSVLSNFIIVSIFLNLESATLFLLPTRFLSIKVYCVSSSRNWKCESHVLYLLLSIYSVVNVYITDSDWK